jgi:hypothetical protein
MPALLLESVFRGLQGPVKKPVIPALQITHLEVSPDACTGTAKNRHSNPAASKFFSMDPIRMVIPPKSNI